MKTNAIILAAGKQARWEQARRFPTEHKQLLLLDNERIICRIIRQCRTRGVEPTVVTVHQAIRDAVDATCIAPVVYSCTTETLRCSPITEGHTIVLLGDVIYSKPLMDHIFANAAPMQVFGNEYEIYALAFVFEQVYELLSLAMALVIGHARNGGRGKLRTFYHAYCGLPLASGELEDKILDYVNYKTDYTQDVDTPKEYIQFLNKVVRKGLLDDTK